jgi:hypothetical protein
MDNISTDIKTLNKEVSVNNSKLEHSVNKMQTEKFIGYLAANRALLNKSLQISLDLLCLKLKAVASLEKEESPVSNAEALLRLALTLIERDANLQDKVAQDLSSAKHLICAKDAKEELLKRLKALPFALTYHSASGQALLRFFCELLLNLTNVKLLGAGLERDLSAQLFTIPQDNLGIKAKIALERLLQATLTFIESNQADFKENKGPSKRQAQLQKISPSFERTTAQVMTHYLRRALEEFPQGSNYLDSLRQPQSAQNRQYEDELSEKTAQRIHAIIAKAASIAKAGKLMGSTENTPTEVEAVAAPVHHLAQTLNDSPQELTTDASKLSLKELAARAARLQEQFRKERQQMAASGKLPDPAIMPTPPKAPVRPQATENTATPIPREIKSTGDPRQDQVLRALSALASRSKVVAASMERPYDPKDNNQSYIPTDDPCEDKEDKSLNLSSGIKVSYSASQNQSFGLVDSIPGMTIPTSDLKVETIADLSQLKSFAKSKNSDEIKSD